MRATVPRAAILATCATLIACGGASEEPCNVSAVTSCPTATLHYSDVQPIIGQRCLSCHDGSTEQWPLTDYSHVASWFDLIPPMVQTCRMPPPDAHMGMTTAERTTLLTWLHCGFPQ